MYAYACKLQDNHRGEYDINLTPQNIDGLIGFSCLVLVTKYDPMTPTAAGESGIQFRTTRACGEGIEGVTE